MQSYTTVRTSNALDQEVEEILQQSDKRQCTIEEAKNWNLRHQSQTKRNKAKNHEIIYGVEV